MSGARRPGVLRIGDRVRSGSAVRMVVGLSGTVVHLADTRGRTESLAMTNLLAGEGFQILGGAGRQPVPASTLEGLPEVAVETALWWEAHLLEVLDGLAPDASPGTIPKPEYDPIHRSLTEREAAKAVELTAAGHRVTASTVKHRRQRYEARGLVALVDHRADKRMPRFGRVDPRVVEAMQAAIAETEQASSRTAGHVLWRTGQILAETSGETAVLPSRSTLYRLFNKLSAGLHTTGSARTRRSMASRPKGPFSTLPVAAPGEVVQIDSTPLDIMVLLSDGVPGRVEMTGMIDVATRTVTAAVLRPTTKSVDASVLLARTVTPESMRPGWTDALMMARSVLPHQRLLAVDERLEYAAAKPVIVPETIVCDHGKVFISRNFRSSCRFLGINFQPTHPGSPSEKPHIEKMMSSVGTLFCQFVAGYTGSNTERRGRHVESGPLWSMLELQELLEEWIVARWQNRRHDGLRAPQAPGQPFTPNEKYAAMVEAAGYVPVALSGEDYIELLPACWRAVNAYGIKINHRTYDDAALGPMRQQPSGIAGKRNLWEVHCDPYDVSRIWVRDHWNGGWITLFWKHLRKDGVPFGELAWDHARRQLPGAGRTATEEEIAQAVDTLLHKAAAGPPERTPPSRRDRRTAARTRAVDTASERLPASPAGTADRSRHEDQKPGAETEDDTPDETTAKIIPLGIFDPFEEAGRRW
ncbi:DDE-type integrase/transposase/recombinase [Streptomyces sp. SID8382]|uniref:Mu transposase C-terminal domain-containing protein n=1 Tax=Streptomyces malaysiensis TaxID=92644 RepID=UPI000C2B6750|nr:MULTISPECIES: Mu transposase C-terminal domain-containing protein [unclassified Streptomyces]AUA17284.1 Integrase core domain protein [Streptomyces sp. M56]MYX59199.1 DDE-type integrase/transposase/recombinase [Streptomyces sp. SID8382]